jgi:hypothetical protein
MKQPSQQLMKVQDWMEQAFNREDIREKIVKAIETGLTANRHQWEGKAQCAYEVPDYGIRIKAAELALNYIIGRPVERSQIVVAHQRSIDPKELIEKSPALRRALKHLVESEQEGKDEISS